MSMHYSKAGLNTYENTPYFQAHIPEEYPIHDIMVKCRAFRRLPPNIQILSALAKKWSDRVIGPIVGRDTWYDEEGYELNPFTGARLTDAEIDAQWGDTPELDKLTVDDIPVPDGGFPDPDTWKEPEPEPEKEDEDLDLATEAQVISDIRDRGIQYTLKYYGIPEDQREGVKTEEDAARLILDRVNSPGTP